MKAASLLIAALLVMVLLACETQPTPTATSGPSPTPTRTRAQLLTGIPPTLTPTPHPMASGSSAPRTQVIPPMESLSRFTVECLEERLPTLEAGRYVHSHSQGVWLTVSPPRNWLTPGDTFRPKAARRRSWNSSATTPGLIPSAPCSPISAQTCLRPPNLPATRPAPSSSRSALPRPERPSGTPGTRRPSISAGG